MDDNERELAQAAATLTVEDYRFLESRGVLRKRPPVSQQEADTQETDTPATVTAEAITGEAVAQDSPVQATDTQEPRPRKRRTRTKVEHEWPEVGALLRGEYRGTIYEAVVIPAARYKSGRAIRITTGPATGKVSHSMSGAMLLATEKQRKELNAGRKGIANGWEFWKVSE